MAANGTNSAPAHHNTPWLRRFATNLVQTFALLFWIAGALAFVAGMPPSPLAEFSTVVNMKR